jgi:hypothetical protein
MRLTASGLWVEAGLELEAYNARQLVDASEGIKKSLARGCGARLSGFNKREGLAEFITRCSGGTWRQEVSFEDWDAILEVIAGEEEGGEPLDIERMTPEQIIKSPVLRDLLRESDIIVWCQCDSYKYSYAYLAWTLKYGELGEAWAKPPSIRNPNYSGALCKHLIAVCDQYLK